MTDEELDAIAWDIGYGLQVKDYPLAQAKLAATIRLVCNQLDDTSEDVAALEDLAQRLEK